MTIRPPQCRTLAIDAFASPVALRLCEVIKRIKKAKVGVHDVHDLRVSARCLEVAIGWAGGRPSGRARKALATLRRIRDQAGKVRDCDVAENLVDALVARGGRRYEASALLLRKFIRNRREKAARRLVKATERKASKRLWKTAMEVICNVSIGVGPAQRKIKQACATATRLAARGGDSIEDLHDARIAIKRVRYAAELAEPLLGARASVLARRSRRAAESIGRALDLHILLELLDRVTLKHRRRGLVLTPLRTPLDRQWHLARKRAIRALAIFRSHIDKNLPATPGQ